MCVCVCKREIDKRLRLKNIVTLLIHFRNLRGDRATSAPILRFPTLFHISQRTHTSAAEHKAPTQNIESWGSQQVNREAISVLICFQDADFKKDINQHTSELLRIESRGKKETHNHSLVLSSFSVIGEEIETKATHAAT
jgi:hypothetical protein